MLPSHPLSLREIPWNNDEIISSPHTTMVTTEAIAKILGLHTVNTTKKTGRVGKAIGMPGRVDLEDTFDTSAGLDSIIHGLQHEMESVQWADNSELVARIFLWHTIKFGENLIKRREAAINILSYCFSLWKRSEQEYLDVCRSIAQITHTGEFEFIKAWTKKMSPAEIEILQEIEQSLLYGGQIQNVILDAIEQVTKINQRPLITSMHISSVNPYSIGLTIIWNSGTEKWRCILTLSKENQILQKTGRLYVTRGPNQGIGTTNIDLSVSAG